MTKEQFEAEKLYQSSLAIARTMLKKALVTEGEFNMIEASLREKYHPKLGTLFAHIPLT
jgi:hypothetical protein